jgi:hypothetical protein
LGSGILTLHDRRTEALDLPTFDPLALMWQAYFSRRSTTRRR